MIKMEPYLAGMQVLQKLQIVYEIWPIVLEDVSIGSEKQVSDPKRN